MQSRDSLLKNTSNVSGCRSSCKLPKKSDEESPKPLIIETPGRDPRFPNTDQTLRCYTSYVDFHQCEYLLGENNEACQWFKKVFEQICPSRWIERWDEQRRENKFPWHKKAKFPAAPYGKI